MTPQEVREWLMQVSDAQRRLLANEATIEAAGISPSLSPKSRSGTSDPTSRAAMLSEENDLLRAQVREGEELCRGVRKALGIPGNVLELRYIGLMTWPQIAEALSPMRLSVRQIRREEQHAREWVSFVGIPRAKAGRGAAEA